jgi:hypothetical protein
MPLMDARVQRDLSRNVAAVGLAPYHRPRKTPSGPMYRARTARPGAALSGSGSERPSLPAKSPGAAIPGLHRLNSHFRDDLGHCRRLVHDRARAGVTYSFHQGSGSASNASGLRAFRTSSQRLATLAVNGRVASASLTSVPSSSGFDSAQTSVWVSVRTFTALRSNPLPRCQS